MGGLEGELQQAVVSWCSLLIARSCMHGINYMRVLGLAEDLEARVLKSMLKRKLRATHRVRRRVPRKTGDGTCKDSGGGTVGVERIGSDGNPEAFSLLRAKRSSHARRATGLAKTAGAGRWVWSESVPTENPRRFHF